MYRIDAQTIKQRKSGTFAGNGTFFLMEFPMMQFPSDAEDALFEYQLAGLRPIIAHPERNADLAREPKLVDALAKRGILFQVNARSLSGSARSEDRFAAETMLRMGAIHFVASDAHHPDVRPARLREAFDRVCELAGEDRARALFITNPRAAIAGDRVFEIGVDPSKNIPWWQRIPGFGKVHGSDD
jgi:protein-tyrosine phosphatase